MLTMNESRKQMWKAIMVGLVLLVISLACGGSATTNRPSKSNDLCAYAASATDFLQQTHNVLTDVHIGDDAAIQKDFDKLDRLATDFGSLTAPAQGRDLKIRTTGTIVAAGEILKAFLRGEDGQTEASLFVAIRKSANEDIAQIRTDHGCK